MGLFSKKDGQPQSHIVPDIKKEISEWSDLNPSMLSDHKMMDDIIQKQVFNYDNFQQPAGSDSEGNYFGSEFDVNATVGRIKTLYMKEPWVYATASLIARTLSSVDFKVYDKGNDEELPKHPLNNLVNSGNYINDATTRNWSGYLDLSLGGNFFYVTDEKYTQAFLVPVEYVTPILRTINTEQDRKDIFEIGPIKEIQIADNNVIQLGQKVIPIQQVVHFKLPNPFNPFYGMPMYAAAARPILLDRYKNEFEMAFYLRGGSNSGVIETEKDITRTRMERLMRTFEQAFTGRRNWWRQLFLPAGAKWVNSGLTMSEMQHLEGLRENRLSLLAVLGVPPSQVGIVQDVNRATAEVQESVFWQNTIVPLAYFVAAGWNNSFVVKNVYKGKIYVAPDLTGIDALEGSLLTKAQLAKESSQFLTINEIRKDIFGYAPLKETDPRGNMFAAEVMRGLHVMGAMPADGDIGPDEEQSTSKALNIGNTDDGNGIHRHVHYAEWDGNGNGMTVGSIEGEGPEHQHQINEFKVLPTGDDYHDHPDLKMLDDPIKVAKAKFKQQVKASQEKIETTYTSKYRKAFKKYVDVLVAQARQALRDNRDVGSALIAGQQKRSKVFMEETLPILNETMELGFNMGQKNTKSLTKIHTKATQFNDTDEEAIEVIRSRTRDGERTLLASRNLDGFIDADGGIDKTRTEQMMRTIDNGLQQGRTTEQIAGTLASDYGEAYQDQAFTVARTEILTAVSQGMAWNHDTLKQIFTEVNKQWVHVGDELTNPDARSEHAAFEDEGNNGVVPSDYLYTNPTTGNQLRYPRDPLGGAADVINCRCSIGNVIPDSSHSRSDIIVNT